MTPDCSQYDPADFPMDVTPQQELSLEHFPGVFDNVVDGHHVPMFLRKQAPRDPPVGAAFEAAIESDYRKTVPLVSGCLDYFPDALCAVAEMSYWGNEKHNPGESLHDARGKSGDDADALLRHLKDRGTFDQLILNDGRAVRIRHSAAVAWRALRLLQRELEEAGAPRARAAKD